jgi:ribose-phosphate pyrophosphokinase
VDDDRFKIFSGTAHVPLAENICRNLNVPIGKALLGRFSDGEIYFQILENVRGADVFVVQPCCYPVDNHLLELLLMIDAFKRASAWRITAVLPYYCYARQDRKDKPRVPISAKLVADLLETAGASRALTLDLHAPQIQGYFDVPVDHLYGSPVLVEYFRQMHLPDLTVVSPDAGGVERARFFATKMQAPLAIVDKRRTDLNVTEVMNVIGDVHGRTCLIIDDIIDTAGTLVKTAQALLDAGAVKVYAAASHPVLSGPAIERISSSRLEEVIVTDSIPLREEAQKLERLGKIKVLSVAGLLGATIESIHMETSVSSLFS